MDSRKPDQEPCMKLNSLELKVISCKDLKTAFNFFQKLSVSAIVSIVNENPKKKKNQQLQQQKTPIDRDGDGNPEWNHEMKFDLKDISFLDYDHLFIEFDLRSEGIIFGINTIGEVRVRFKDLIDEFNGAVRFVSYQVRTTDGKSNGILNFSYKMNKEEKKIGNDFATNVNCVFPGVYPPKQEEDHYPSYYLPPGIHYPAVDTLYPSPEIHLRPPPPPPPQGVYPPPPPPAFSPYMVAQGPYYPPMASPLEYYMPPPDLYGFGSGEYGSYRMSGYPALQEQRQSGNDTWRNELRGGGDGYAGFWNGR